MPINVRPYTEADKDAVRLICVATADYRVRSATRRMLLLKTACEYYLECEPENCFVAVRSDDDGEKVIGYVLCAGNFETYARRYMNKYLPKLKEYSKFSARVARADVMLFGQFATFFPAHLRLGVLREERGQGAGEALVTSVADRLRAQRGKGIVVILNKKNTEAAAFFKRCGFSFLRKTPGGNAYGLDL